MQLNPYASFLNNQDPIAVITRTAPRLRALTAPLTSAQVISSPAPGKWSITEIVSHLADCEIVFSFRLRQTLAAVPDQPHPIIQPFDQDLWAQRYSSYQLEPALALFSATRNWNLLFLATITAEERHLPTTHPERGTMTLWTIVETMGGHDINHLQQLERLTFAAKTTSA
jgi:DinB superfamily